jgi:hypothetical protein
MNSYLGIFTPPLARDFQRKPLSAGNFVVCSCTRQSWLIDVNNIYSTTGIMICTSRRCNLHELVCMIHVCTEREREREREREITSWGSKESDGELQKILLTTVCFC